MSITFSDFFRFPEAENPARLVFVAGVLSGGNFRRVAGILEGFSFMSRCIARNELDPLCGEISICRRPFRSHFFRARRAVGTAFWGRRKSKPFFAERIFPQPPHCALGYSFSAAERAYETRKGARARPRGLERRKRLRDFYVVFPFGARRRFCEFHEGDCGGRIAENLF